MLRPKSIFIEIRPWTMEKDKLFRKEMRKKFQELVSFQWQPRQLIKRPVALKIVFWYKKRENPRGRHMDLDNMIKVVCDALTGLIYEDDNQVIKIWAEKKEDSFLEGISLVMSY